MTTACYLCGDAADRRIYRTGPWHYLRCPSCGLVHLHPQPTDEDLTASYQSYLPETDDAIDRWHAMMRPVICDSADRIERLAAPKGRILDVGCGYGFFLAEMKQRGWDTVGLEPSPTGRRHARDAYGITMHADRLEDAPFDDASFDAISLFYVIEHVADPLAVLGHVRRLLRPGGVLFLRWPHSTPIVRLIGPAAHLLDLYHTPFHLYDFNPKNLAQLVTRAGFGQIATFPGANTLPAGRAARWTTRAFGQLGRLMHAVSGERWMLPGISKSTIAIRQ